MRGWWRRMNATACCRWPGSLPISSIGPAQVLAPCRSQHGARRLRLEESLLRRAVAAQLARCEVAQPDVQAARRVPGDGAAESDLEVVRVRSECQQVECHLISCLHFSLAPRPPRRSLTKAGSPGAFSWPMHSRRCSPAWPQALRPFRVLSAGLSREAARSYPPEVGSHGCRHEGGSHGCRMKADSTAATIRISGVSGTRTLRRRTPPDPESDAAGCGSPGRHPSRCGSHRPGRRDDAGSCDAVR